MENLRSQRLSSNPDSTTPHLYKCWTSSLTFLILDVFICNVELRSRSQLLCNNSPRNSVASNNHHMSNHRSQRELGSAGHSCLGSLLRLQSFGNWSCKVQESLTRAARASAPTVMRAPLLPGACHHLGRKTGAPYVEARTFQEKGRSCIAFASEGCGIARYHSLTSYWPGDATKGGEMDSTS